MAIDTANKRASAVGEFSFFETLPFPDSTISAVDRKHTTWTYASDFPTETPGVSRFSTQLFYALPRVQSQGLLISNRVAGELIVDERVGGLLLVEPRA